MAHFFAYSDKECKKPFTHEASVATLHQLCTHPQMYSYHGDECVEVKLDCSKLKPTICIDNKGCHSCDSADMKVRDCVKNTLHQANVSVAPSSGEAS